ncbi:MAG TPA: hypothetical protein VIG45_02955 [Erysipelothrix sp.]
MKRISLILVTLLLMTACKKVIITEKSVFDDINVAQWSCAHGAEPRKFELVGDQLLEHVGSPVEKTVTYEIEHLEDNLYKVTPIDVSYSDDVEKTEISEGTVLFIPLIMTIDDKTKDLYLNLYPEDEKFEYFKEISVGHGCELIENIK